MRIKCTLLVYSTVKSIHLYSLAGNSLIWRVCLPLPASWAHRVVLSLRVEAYLLPTDDPEVSFLPPQTSSRVNSCSCCLPIHDPHQIRVIVCLSSVLLQ
jgi:hypothetical protein